MIYILTFIIALLITPIVRRLALRNGITDKADGDYLKIHKEPIALLGGVVIFIAMAIGVLSTRYSLLATFYPRLWGVILGSGLIFGVGLWDDVRGVKPIVRLLVQVLVGVAVFLVGIRVNFIPISWIAMPLTLFYIAGAINAFNVIDGMDGLCTGISLVACVGFFFLGLKSGNTLLTGLSAILFMILLGFLPYNFHPARIFLGDAGSGFLGFMLGVMAVIATSKQYNIANFIAPILVISVPVLDMAFAIARRFVRGESLFIGDREHIYDVLLREGLTNLGTVPFGDSPCRTKKGWSQPRVWSVVCGAQMAMVGIALIIASRG